MRCCQQLVIVIALSVCCSLYTYEASAATIAAASCTRAAVLTAYNAASAGDTITIPTGNCDTSNQWGSYLTITKNGIRIQGNGAANTIIGISASGAGFQIQANNVRITEITFDCNFATSAGAGIIRIGSGAVNPTYVYRDYRIDNNTFNQCGASGGDTTGKDAISPQGFVYGVIDHNTFNDCNGECIDICGDATPATLRSTAFGQYTNGTTFVEDNIFNANRSILYENVIDGNSGQRFVFRHNTINISDGARYLSDIISTHETCATCSGSSVTGGDAGSLVGEMYENTINLNTTGRMLGLMRARAGKTLTYNNHITYSGSSDNRWSAGAVISNYRSGEYVAGNVGFCGAAANPRGYADVCHEVNGTLITEGLEANKTTLNGAIDSSVTTLSLTSTSGFSANGVANGFATKIDSEVITFTGVSGNQLTGLTRGANGTTAASHSNNANINYLKFGVCVEQPNNVYIWNNDINGLVTSALNDVSVGTFGNKSILDYTAFDIQSFAQRPNNWQYRTETPYSYAAYSYPHPLTLTTPGPPPSPPSNLRIIP